MKHTKLIRALSPAIAGLALAGSPAHADLISVDATLDPANVAVAAETGAAAWSSNWAPVVSRPNTAFILEATTAAEGTLRASAAAPAAAAVPAGISASLWTFITSIRAQQQGDRFVILETNASLLQLAEGPAAAVPLPPTLWLMVVGILGFAGVRLTGREIGSRKPDAAAGGAAEARVQPAFGGGLPQPA